MKKPTATSKWYNVFIDGCDMTGITKENCRQKAREAQKRYPTAKVECVSSYKDKDTGKWVDINLKF